MYTACNFFSNTVSSPTSRLKILLLSCAIISGCLHSNSQQTTPDSIPSQQNHKLANDTASTSLKELTVRASPQNVGLASTSYYPAPDVKRSATDAIDLLQRMSMSEIHIDPVTKAITTIAGNDVRLFINFLPASEGDIAGLRGQDVKKVEVLDYPTDLRFEGAHHVVNILLRSFNYGGYTRLSDNHTFVVADDNHGSIFSRLNNRRMTYDLFVGSNLTSTSHASSNHTSVYNLEGGAVQRLTESSGSRRKVWQIPVSFRASYSSDNVSVDNTLGYSFSDTYSQFDTGRLSFIPDRFSAPLSYSSDRTGNSNGLSYSGRLFISLPREWSLYVRPFFSFAHTRYHREYATDVPGFAPILTNARENSYYYFIIAGASKECGNAHYLDFSIDLTQSRNRLRYSGTDNESARIISSEMTAAATYSFTPNRRFNLRAAVSLYAIRNSSGDDRMSNIAPAASLSAAFKPSAKSRFRLSSSISQSSPSSVYVNDLLVQLNELEYRKGNPMLKPWYRLNNQFSYTYMPISQLNLSAFVRHRGGLNVLSMVYERNPAGDAIWMTKRNTGHYNILSAGLSLSASLLEGRLSLSASPAFVHNNLKTFFRVVHNQFDFSVNAQYYTGKFSFSAYYQPEAWTLHPTAGIRDTNRAYYYVGANWSNSSWNISLRALNFFRYTYHGQTTRIDATDYSTKIDINIPVYHASLQLTAVFTFGYGKKVSRGNEVGAQGGASSAIPD